MKITCFETTQVITIFALFENRPYIVAKSMANHYMWEPNGCNKAQKLKVQR